MFALLSAIVFLFVAFGNVEAGTVSLFYIGLTLWALHFAFPIRLYTQRKPLLGKDENR